MGKSTRSFSLLLQLTNTPVMWLASGSETTAMEIILLIVQSLP